MKPSPVILDVQRLFWAPDVHRCCGCIDSLIRCELKVTHLRTRRESRFKGIQRLLNQWSTQCRGVECRIFQSQSYPTDSISHRLPPLKISSLQTCSTSWATLLYQHSAAASPSFTSWQNDFFMAFLEPFCLSSESFLSSCLSLMRQHLGERGGKGWSKQNERELTEQHGWWRFYKTRVKRLWSSWSCWLFLPGFSPEKCGHHYLQINVLMLYSLGLTNPHIYAFQPQPDVKVHWFPHQCWSTTGMCVKPRFIHNSMNSS